MPSIRSLQQSGRCAEAMGKGRASAGRRSAGLLNGRSGRCTGHPARSASRYRANCIRQKRASALLLRRGRPAGTRGNAAKRRSSSAIVPADAGMVTAAEPFRSPWPGYCTLPRAFTLRARCPDTGERHGKIPACLAARRARGTACPGLSVHASVASRTGARGEPLASVRVALPRGRSTARQANSECGRRHGDARQDAPAGEANYRSRSRSAGSIRRWLRANAR